MNVTALMCLIPTSLKHKTFLICLLNIGGVAQMVERSLSMWEVRGSMPRSSKLFLVHFKAKLFKLTDWNNVSFNHPLTFFFHNYGEGTNNNSKSKHLFHILGALFFCFCFWFFPWMTFFWRRSCSIIWLQVNSYLDILLNQINSLY